VLNPGEDVCHERNKARPDRQFGPQLIRRQTANLKRDIRGLDREGFRYVRELRSVGAIDAAEIARAPLWTDRRAEAGPFDIVGDVHGCADELETLLSNLRTELRPCLFWTGREQLRDRHHRQYASSVGMAAPPSPIG
jgi:protein phosphatase